MEHGIPKTTYKQTQFFLERNVPMHEMYAQHVKPCSHDNRSEATP